ncbi:MAG: tetratricopeptide repeat protein [Prevotellaceae bacterium]|jgi:tetratricopeptide (TPR) repeat protein|nr:tetratricopeptide repeat protein [Prevotellaceae bacterium]
MTIDFYKKKGCTGSRKVKPVQGKSFLLLLTALCLSSLPAMSQKLIIERDTVTSSGLCTVGETDACVIIVADTLLRLTFESSMDSKVDIVSRREVGSTVQYLLRFPTGYIYAKRALEIMSPVMASAEIEDFNLQPKESRTYIVTAPKCYLEAYKDALELFRKGAYTESKEKYRQAVKCFDVPLDENTASKIAVIDSIMILKKIADRSFEILDYENALTRYQKILSYNQEDEGVAIRYAECIAQKDQSCIRYFSDAEKYFNQNEVERAKALYEKVIATGCGTYHFQIATERLNIIEEKVQPTTALTYEWMESAPIGISAGSYKNRKTGGFFTLQLNTDLFEAMRSNYEKAQRPEVDASFGWTVRPERKYVPVWIFFGPGYTGVGEYAYENENSDKPKFSFYHAISPQIGLLGKIGPVALRYTFQYRFAMKKEYEAYIGSFRHVFGAGFCF